MRPHCRSVLGALMQCTALAMLPTYAAFAQELPTESYWDDELRHQDLKTATITAQTLARTHQAVVARLAKLTYTADASGASLLPPLLDHFFAHASLTGYAGDDAPYNVGAARDWNIRHRVCPNPNDLRTFVVLTWLEQDIFRSGDTARMIQAAPRAYYETVGGTFDSDSEIGLLAPRARSGGSVRFAYTDFAGAETPVPDCAIGSSSGAWTDGSVMPGFEVPAVLSIVPMPNLALEWRDTLETQVGVCPPAGSPDLTISGAGGARETRQRRSLVDRAGRPIQTAAGTTVPDQFTPWTYQGGCRAPRRQTVTLVEECTYTSLGVDLQGQRIYLVDTYEAVPPAPYTDEVGIGQEKWLIVPGTTPRLISNGCTDTGAPPVINTAMQQSQIVEPLSCPSIYTPSVHAHIPYTLGAISRQRTRTTYTTTFPSDAQMEPITADSFTPWAWGADSCHRVYQIPTTETSSAGCPAGYTGSITQQRTRTDTTTDYANPAFGDSTAVSYSDWSTVSNGCSQIINASSGGGGGGNYSYDVNGDGRGDFASYSDAAKYTQANGGRVNEVRSDCGSCNGPSTTPGSGGSSGNISGSGGGFWSGLGNAISSLFGGGSSSSSSGGGSSGSSSRRVICTELWRQGRVSRELAVMDLRFTAERLSPAHYRGYHAWAIPVVHKMRKSQRWTTVWHFLAVHRMNEIAWQLGRADRPDYIGKLVRHTLEPISWLIGQFVGESNEALTILEQTSHRRGPATAADPLGA